MTDPPNPFDNPLQVNDYAERAKHMVPTYSDIHRMATVLIDEHRPDRSTRRQVC